jgi:hypothetical protein
MVDTAASRAYRRALTTEDTVADGFDINDRNTWAWTNVGEFAGVPEGGMYGIDTEQRHRFYRRGDDGIPYRHDCPAGQDFNPILRACDLPEKCPEDQVYDWAVSKGLVTDQR